MEEDLPLVVAQDPDGGTVCGGGCGGGVVSREGYIRSEEGDIEEGDRGGSRMAGEEVRDGLFAAEDEAGAAELLEVAGEELDENGTVRLAVGMEEPLFESVEVIL